MATDRVAYTELVLPSRLWLLQTMFEHFHVNIVVGEWVVLVVLWHLIRVVTTVTLGGVPFATCVCMCVCREMMDYKQSASIKLDVLVSNLRSLERSATECNYRLENKRFMWELWVLKNNYQNISF